MMVTPAILVDRTIRGMIEGENVRHIKLSDGRIELPAQKPPKSPWRFLKYATWMNCSLWKHITFFRLVEKLPRHQKFVPSWCQDCWKVVVRPKTYKQLLELEGIMGGMDTECKCGVEIRKEVQGLYGGYFYCQSKERGLDMLDLVREKAGHIGRVFLKRSCTEYEHSLGPSDKWKLFPFQLQIEGEFERRIYINTNTPPQSQDSIDECHRLWKEFAHKFDPTFEGSLYPKYVTYERNGHAKG